MNDNRHQDGIYPFPPVCSREIETNGADHVRVGGHGPRCHATASAQRATWGHLAARSSRPHGCRARPRGLGLSSKPDVWL